LKITLNLNGRPITSEVEASVLAVDWLRETMGQTGTHVGCDTSQCGACTVLLDDVSVKSCTLLAVSLDGGRLTTIEGLSGAGGALHPMQQAFHEHHGLQCGFCTPGMILRAVDMASGRPELEEAHVRRELEGNICRCTGYQNIVAAVIAGARAMGASAGGE
jgi:carbon-monoxide dehydrogenase small subunit